MLDIRVINKKLRYEIPNNLKKKLCNNILSKIIRRGKYLIFLFSNNNTILFHLGMTGTFRLSRSATIRKHDHIIFFFKNSSLIYNDIRKFGFLKFYKHDEVNLSSHLINLGPEPLGKNFSHKYIEKNIKKNTNIKNLLMNQGFVAGLGNIYCSEILFEARINPKKIAKNLNNQEIRNLKDSTKKILKKAISYGGTTIKNFIVSDQEIGYFKNKLNVYGKNKFGCKRCGTDKIIKKILQNGRSTFFCPGCQL